jgi:hypothetical protein
LYAPVEETTQQTKRSPTDPRDQKIPPSLADDGLELLPVIPKKRSFWMHTSMIGFITPMMESGPDAVGNPTEVSTCQFCHSLLLRSKARPSPYWPTVAAPPELET